MISYKCIFIEKIRILRNCVRKMNKAFAHFVIFYFISSYQQYLDGFLNFKLRLLKLE